MKRKALVSLVCVTAMLLALVAAGPFSYASTPDTSEAEVGAAPGGHGMGLIRSEPGSGRKVATDKLF